MKTAERSRERDEMEAQVTRWSKLPARICMKLIGARDEDLEQIGIVAMVEAWERYDAEKGKPQTLFWIAAHSRMVGELRHRRQQVQFECEFTDSDFSRFGYQENWRERAERTDVVREVNIAFSELPRVNQEAIYLRFWEGLGWREVGERTGVTEFGAKARVLSGLKVLRTRLSFLEE